MQHAYWSSSSSLLNIIKLSQSVWEMAYTRFPLQGDIYITETVSVVSLIRDTPTGPPLDSYQILLKYV